MLFVPPSTVNQTWQCTNDSPLICHKKALGSLSRCPAPSRWSVPPKIFFIFDVVVVALDPADTQLMLISSK